MCRVRCVRYLLAQVPSAYFLTDCYLYLDLTLGRRLFKPVSESRQEMAGCEGVKAKKMLGGLRYLWRSSQDGAHDPRIRDLKSFLRSSPRRAPAHAVTCLVVWAVFLLCFFCQRTKCVYCLSLGCFGKFDLF